MLYSDYIEQEYEKIMNEVFSLFKSKSSAIQKNKLNKARLNINAKRISLLRGKEAAKGKVKSEEQLQALARKSARRILSKKLMGKIYDDLTDQERIEFNKRKNNKIELYKRLQKEEYNKLKAKYNQSNINAKKNKKD